MDDPEGLFQRARDAGVGVLICIGTDARTSALAREMSAEHRGSVHFSVGLHPHEGTVGLDDVIDLAYDNDRNKASSLVAIGECGLDYYYEHSPRDAQRQSFIRQIAIAEDLDVALVVHSRDAWDDTLEILRTESNCSRTVIHCFTGGVEEARRCLDLGFYLSFNGITTFKNSHEVRAAAEFCPLDRMILETDSPYLAPTPLRGSINEPGNIPLIGSYIAQLKGVDEDKLKSVISTTTKQVFRLQ